MFQKQAEDARKGVQVFQKQQMPIIKELLNQKYTMLNPLLTKFVQINNIFYTKTYSVMQPISSLDPNKYMNRKETPQPQD